MRKKDCNREQPLVQWCAKTWGLVLEVLGALGQLLGVDFPGWEARGFLGTEVVRAEDFFGDRVGWQRLECSQWVCCLCCKMIGQSKASWDYSWWWGRSFT